MNTLSLGKMLIPFEDRLGKKVVIKRIKIDQLMKKQRYLNTI